MKKVLNKLVSVLGKERIKGVIRHVLTWLGGFLVLKGVIDEVMVTEIVGLIMTAIGLFWSVADKD